MADDTNKGLTLALIGTLVILPDTVLMRLSGLDAAQMVAWRGLLQATMLIGLWLVLSRHKRGELSATFTVTGLAAIALQAANAGLFATGIALAPVAVVLFAVATTPLVSALLGALFLGDRLQPVTLGAAVLVLVGIGVSVSGEYGGTGSAVIGALCGGMVSIALAGGFTIYRARPDLSVMLSVGSGAAISGLVGLSLAPSMFQTDGYLPAIWVTGLVILPVSFTMFGMASRYTVAANVSLVLLLETVLGPIGVWAVVGEPVGPRGLIGGAIVVVTLAAYLWDQRRRALRQRPPPAASRG